MIWKMARSLKAVFDLSAAFSIRRASIKCCAICFAMSRVMEKVVVVVVVMILSGLRGSGPRFDWENLREARLVAASSLISRD